ncbi:hypothetical protein CS0771_54400 [Catellatospora sp. IY07-71]|nr:hypothetical protein CS0771_54400 [Catellatospora sp. IY07-71]
MGWPVLTRDQMPAVLRFDGGEGCWYERGVCYFTTKGDDRCGRTPPGTRRSGWPTTRRGRATTRR